MVDSKLVFILITELFKPYSEIALVIDVINNQTTCLFYEVICFNTKLLCGQVIMQGNSCSGSVV